MQSQLKAVGFEVTLKTYDMGTYWDNLDAGKFDVAMTGWTGEADPDAFLYRPVHRRLPQFLPLEPQGLCRPGDPGEAGFRHPGPEQAVLPGGKDPHGRGADPHARPGREYRPMSKKVQGFIMYPNGKIYLSGVSLDK